jgi:hypothetical protein
VSRHVMTATQSGKQGLARVGVCALENGGEELRVCVPGDRDAGEAIGVGNGDKIVPDMEPTLATGCGGQASKKSWTEEPRGEDEPRSGGEEPLEGPACAIERGGDKERKESGGGPCPRPLEEEDIEKTAVGGKRVGGSKGVRVGREKRIRGIEVSRIAQRIENAVSNEDSDAEER